MAMLFLKRFSQSSYHLRYYNKVSEISSAALQQESVVPVCPQRVVEAVAVPVATTPTVDASYRGVLNNSTFVIKDSISGNQVKRPSWLPTPTLESNQLLSQYKKLSKFRLTSLVVITAMGGYAMAPAPFELATFLMCSIGTGFVSAAANSINQYHEVPFDSQMSRTKNRVLVTGQLSPLHAMGFAVISAAAGLSLLYFGVNGLTATLGASNLILYTTIYTPMKRTSILNTWIGSIVGAIPPLMGWAGCSGTLDAGAWILAGVLYAWQFPHFNALSWNLRPDYSRAGYRMMAVTNPALCRRTALKYTGVIGVLSLLAPAFDVTNPWFALETLPLNAYFCYLAYRFYKNSDSNNSRKLFRFSLVHLPALMLLFLLNKKHWFFTEKPSLILNETSVHELNTSDDARSLDKSSNDLKTSSPISISNVLPATIAVSSVHISNKQN